MKKFSFKIVFNIFVILIVLGLVLYLSLKDNYTIIIDQIKNMNPIWLVVAILFLIVYRTMIGISSWLMVRINGEKVNLLKMIQFNFIILFFHGVTPFSGGGQPMEIYYIHNEGVDTTKATNIVTQNFIIYQTALMIICVMAVIFNNAVGLFPDDSFMKKLVVLGFAINFLVWILSYVISFSNKFDKFVSNKVITFLGKLKIIKNPNEKRDKLNNYIAKFNENAKSLTQNKNKVVLITLLNIVAILLLHAIPYAVMLGLGVKISLINVLVATTYVMIIGSFVPIPGGTGGLEYGFVYFFSYFIKGPVVTSGMLIWRFVSYYLGMIIGAVALMLYRKRDNKCE